MKNKVATKYKAKLAFSIAFVGALAFSSSVFAEDDMMGSMPPSQPANTMPADTTDTSNMDHDHDQMKKDHEEMAKDHKKMKKDAKAKKADGKKPMQMGKKKQMPMNNSGSAPMMDDDSMGMGSGSGSGMGSGSSGSGNSGSGNSGSGNSGGGMGHM